MRQNPLALIVILAVGLCGLALLLTVAGVLPPFFGKKDFDPDDYAAPVFQYRLVDFSDLPGWRQDSQAETLGAFLRSCEKIQDKDPASPANPIEALGSGVPDGVSVAGEISDWTPICVAAAEISKRNYADDNARTSALRVFYEQYFQPLQIINYREPLPDAPARRKPVADPRGLFTGYFEPVYPASNYRTDEFSAPLLTRPDDLIMVDLGRFRESLAGERVAGKVENGRLIPYADHAAINRGALEEGVETIAWMRPNDLFFLQIQGSGKLSLRGQSEIRVGYAAQNGHPYTAIGRSLVERGEMALEDVTMQSIRDWLDRASPEEAASLREENKSYVFFQRLDSLPEPDLGPLGANGVQLTAGRSLAVDRRYHALGAPVWVSIVPQSEDENDRLQKLFIAQDTGGAIRGPVRGDIFAGSGPEAGEFAGGLRAVGELYVLTPKAVAARLPAIDRAAANAAAPFLAGE